MEKGNKIKVSIQAANGSTSQITVSDILTGYQLKEYIFANVTDTLAVLQMKLYYAGVKIQDDKLLSSYKFVQDSTTKILQMKCKLNQIQGLIVAYQVDQISGETTTARMPCGHVIGRDCMTQYLRSLVQSNVYKIKCPSYKTDGTHCEAEWDFGLCRKVGVLTKEEVQEFQTGLSKNWIRQFTIECPQCKKNLFQGDLETKRVKCPRCNYGDFCSICCKKWIGPNNKICGNKCNSINEFLKVSPWDKTFNLTVLTEKVKRQFKAPKHRACPNCNVLIEHSSGCKHMACNGCKKSFCWICLELKENNWKCGGAFDYCGKIAQVQTISL